MARSGKALTHGLAAVAPAGSGRALLPPARIAGLRSGEPTRIALRLTTENYVDTGHEIVAALTRQASCTLENHDPSSKTKNPAIKATYIQTGEQMCNRAAAYSALRHKVTSTRTQEPHQRAHMQPCQCHSQSGLLTG